VVIYSGSFAAFVFYRKGYKMNVAAVFPALWGKQCKNSFYPPGGYGKEGIRPCLLVTRKLPHCWRIVVIYPKEIQQVKNMAQLKRAWHKIMQKDMYNSSDADSYRAP
jgi:hypothetical protein